MKKLYKIPSGPEVVVETGWTPWDENPSIVVCWAVGDDEPYHSMFFPAHKDDLYDIEPIWRPPVAFAPDWAHWAAFGKYGFAAWYECEPVVWDDAHRSNSGRYLPIGIVPKSIWGLWRESLVEGTRDGE